MTKIKFACLVFASLACVGLGNVQAQPALGIGRSFKNLTPGRSPLLEHKIAQVQTRIITDPSLGFKFLVPSSLRTVKEANTITVYTQAAYEELQTIIKSGLATELPECEAYLEIVRPLPLKQGTIRQNLAASSKNYYLREGYGFGPSLLSKQQALAFTQNMFRAYEAKRVAAVSPGRNYMIIIGSCENRRTFDMIVRSFYFTH